MLGRHEPSGGLDVATAADHLAVPRRVHPLRHQPHALALVKTDHAFFALSSVDCPFGGERVCAHAGGAVCTAAELCVHHDHAPRGQTDDPPEDPMVANPFGNHLGYSVAAAVARQHGDSS